MLICMSAMLLGLSLWGDCLSSPARLVWSPPPSSSICLLSESPLQNPLKSLCTQNKSLCAFWLQTSHDKHDHPPLPISLHGELFHEMSH